MISTNKCSICGTEMKNGVCPMCGCREADDFVKYRTLSAPDVTDIEQRARLKAAAESAQREKAEREAKKADAKTKVNRDGKETVKPEEPPKKYRFTNEEAVKAAARERELREQLYGNGAPKLSDNEYRFAYKKAEQKREPHNSTKAESAKPQNGEYSYAYKKAEPAKPQNGEYSYAYKKAEPAKPQNGEYHHAYKKAEPAGKASGNAAKTAKQTKATAEKKSPNDEKLETGKKLMGKGQYQAAISALYGIADEGSAEAQYTIGLCYKNRGNGESDRQNAKKWFERAAQQGHAEAQKCLKTIEPTKKTASENKKPADVKQTKTTVKTEPKKAETVSKWEKPFENDKIEKSKLKKLMTVRKVSLILLLAFTVIAIFALSLLDGAGMIDSAKADTVANFLGVLCSIAIVTAVITTICIWIRKMNNKY